MDIKSKAGYPASALSNFAPHPFTFDGVEVASMEGLLQSFKFPSEDVQKEVCKLVGYAAKRRGQFRNWRDSQTLHWQGVAYPRQSEAYQELLNRAFRECARQNEGFRKALLATGDAVLTHSIGKADEKETILTRQEFCRILTAIREEIKAGKL